MQLASDVQEQIRRYIVGLVSADDLSDWLSVHAQQVHDAGIPELRRLMDLAFNVLEDEANGLRTEKEAKEILVNWSPMDVAFQGSLIMADQTVAIQIGRAIAVNAVYTPPEWRQRGYATACVAGVSEELLARGYEFCVLYTDLSNPTSNAIYTRIGYRPVRDFIMYALE